MEQPIIAPLFSKICQVEGVFVARDTPLDTLTISMEVRNAIPQSNLHPPPPCSSSEVKGGNLTDLYPRVLGTQLLCDRGPRIHDSPDLRD